MPDNTANNKNIGGFPSNNKSAGQTQTPDNETGNQTPQTEINKKTERSSRPEQA